MVEQGYCSLYDVNNDTSEILNLLRGKDSWKKNVVFFQCTCSDISKWQSQTEFAFGFVPLSDMVVNSKNNIRPAVPDPVQQHFVTKN